MTVIDIAEVRKPGSSSFVTKQAEICPQRIFQGSVFGTYAADFLHSFCSQNRDHAVSLADKAQLRCKDGEDSLRLAQVAENLKLINAHLDRVEHYGKQIEVAPKLPALRWEALEHLSLAYTELEALERFGPKLLS